MSKRFEGVGRRTMRMERLPSISESSSEANPPPSYSGLSDTHSSEDDHPLHDMSTADIEAQLEHSTDDIPAPPAPVPDDAGQPPGQPSLGSCGEAVLGVIAGLVGCAGILLFLFGVIILVIFAFTFFFDALEHVVNTARGDGWFSGK